MRTPVEKIQAAILDPDLELREAAIFYFAVSCSRDPSLMPFVIRAFEQFGLDAFDATSFLGDLAQTADSVEWLIREIERIDPDADDRSYDFSISCIEALWRTDVTALRPHKAKIQRMRQIDDESKAVIADRLYLSTLTPDALWQELAEFCEEQDQELDPSDEEIAFGHSVADALSSYPDQCAAQVMNILSNDEERGGWLELMAIHMAGRLELEDAIPCLIDVLSDPESVADDDARWALVKIGGDRLTLELSRRYAAGDNSLREDIAFLLEDVHTDLSVQTCLELLAREQDPTIQRALIQSVLMNFATAGIEPARQYVLAHPKNPDVLEVRCDLLVACKMMGASFPELQAWTEDAKTDAEFRRQWYIDHPLDPNFESFADGELDLDWADEDFEDDVDMEPPGVIVRQHERIGRNDPCPCGSGKKFKQCCLHKQAPQ